ADQNGTINLQGPLLSQSGLYHFHVNILAIERDDSAITPDRVPRFDAWLSLGGPIHTNVTAAGRSYNLTLISYYDNIKNFTFDQGRKEMTWSIPFSWNLQHIEENNIFVHQEIIIPNSMIKELG